MPVPNINFNCACGASEYAADVANPNFRAIALRLLALEANVTAKAYSNTTRPAADTVAEGTMIFNSDDQAPNWSARFPALNPGDDPVAMWVDASGNET